MARPSRTHAEQIAERSVMRARALLGAGWRHVSPEIQRGLVDSQILGVIASQDDDIPAETVLGYLRELSAAVDVILDAEGK